MNAATYRELSSGFFAPPVPPSALIGINANYVKANYFDQTMFYRLTIANIAV